MSDQIVTLRLTANAAGVVTGVQLASGELGKLGDAAEKSGTKSARGLSKTRVGLESISTQLARVRREVVSTFAAFASVQGIRGVARMADEWANVSAQQRLATRGSVDQAQAMEEVFAIAQRTSTGVATTGNLVARLTQNIAAMGVESKAAFGIGLALSETINQSFAISGASASAQSNAITQFTQALAGGVLRAEEFNSIVENSPRLAQAMADGMKVGMGELRKLVNDGKVQSAEMLKAIQSQASVMDQEFAQLPLTIERAWTTLQNSVLRYIGTADQANSVSARVAQGIAWMADNIDSIVNAVVLMGKVVATVYAVQLIRSGTAWIANLNLQSTAVRGLIVANSQWAASTAGSFAVAKKEIGLLGIAMNVLGAAVVGWQIGTHLRKEFLWVEQGGIALMSGLHQVANVIKNNFIIAWGVIKAAGLSMFNAVLDKFADFADTLASFQEPMPVVGERLASVSRSMADSARGARVETESAAEAFIRLSTVASAELAEIDQGYFELFQAAEANRRATQAGEDAAHGLDDALGGLATTATLTAEELKRLAQAQASFGRENALLAAELEGELSVALHNYRVALEDARKAKMAGEATAAQLTERERLLAAQFNRTEVAINTRMGSAEALLDTMTGELRLLGQLGEEREAQSRMLRAEHDMRRAIADAIEAGNDTLRKSPDEQARLIGDARAMAAYSMEVERNARHLEDWAMLATASVSDVAGVFSDLFSGQVRKAKDFFSQLKDVFKRGFRDMIQTVLQQQFVEPFQRAITGALNGQGFAAAGQNLGSLLARGAASSFAAMTQQAGGVSPGSIAGFGNNVSGLLGAHNTAGASSAGLAQWLAQGKMMGLSLPGLGVGAMTGLSTFNSSGSALGGVVGGIAGYAGQGALAAGMAAMKAGGGIVAGLQAGWSALVSNPVGLAALAALAVDKISGGKLFGTKYKADSSASEYSINAAGASGSTSVTEVRNRSLFRGRQWKTTTSALDADAQASIDELFDTISSTAAEAAARIGIAAPALIGGSFRREFDASGNLKTEFGTIAGRVYKEAEEAFQQRLLGENLLAVAKAAGSAAEIERIAQGYRASAEGLNEVATFLLAVQGDIYQGAQLWSTAGDGVLTDITALFERLNRAGETLVETYERVTSAAMAYGDHIADIDTQLRRSGLSQWQNQALDIELAYREQIRTANDLAKALGLSGARAEDLAKIEQLRAINMATVQRQIEAERNRTLEDLSLSQYSPLDDRKKLSEAMQQLQAAVTSGDVSRARSLSDTALGLGRNLYASGRDYNSVYSQVTGLLGSMGTGNLSLDLDDGTSMGDLADILTDLPRQIASEMFSLLYTPVVPTAPPVTTPAPTPGLGGGGGSVGGGGGGATLDDVYAALQHLGNLQQDLLQRQVELMLQ